MHHTTSTDSITLHPDKDVRVTEQTYHDLYRQSIEQPRTFWADQAEKILTWFQPWEEVCTGAFETHDVNWFVKGQLNACYNCVDRHLETRADQTALIWEGSDPSDSRTYTYQALHQQVCRFANVLKAQGVKKGDRVCLYLPMLPELVFAMLACARIGAIHSVVFSGFSAAALQLRLQDTKSELLITADQSVRGDKMIPLKRQADEALKACPQVKSVIVVQRTGTTDLVWSESRDAWYHDLVKTVDADCPAETMDAGDPLFILYTSGSTGKPKGVVHSTGGYMVYVALTHQVIFDHRDGDVYFCTADPGWITGHSYLVYGPLANGSTTLLFEGVPQYPSHARYWDIVDKYDVTVFYTSPTALRSLRSQGDDWVQKTQRKSLRLLGSVGEPIGAEIWWWYYNIVGEKRCPIVNTWWQTETGGILISALPGDTQGVPGSAGLPFWGIKPEIVDEKGGLVQDDSPGRLVIEQPWPGLMQTIYGDRQRFIESYFKPVPGYYLSGDGAYRDVSGNLIVTGRDDDVIKVSGHRFGTEELESALVSYAGISEAAVIGIPHEVKGECILAFVTPMSEVMPDDALKHALIQHISHTIGPIAKPEHIYWAKGLPKTRSGKIMRRILRKIAKHEYDDIGDTSTLVDATVVDDLIAAQKE
ncbi:MAG: acetate--CoA ligase [Gammaproteobacteria bacterium]|nr:acetate--CoA ligase [Gammaproteobacteria bacterium]